MNRLLCFLLLFTIGTTICKSNDSLPTDTSTHVQNQKRLTSLVIGGSVLYTGSMVGLYQLWYKDYPQSNFHFINDNKEWLQMDKAGHATASYYLGLIGYESLRWAGVEEKQAVWFGGSVGFMFLTVIETLDGFSAEWGASSGDLLANGLGSAAFISQQLIWKEQRVLLKWSFHLTDYAQYRPDLLGSSFAERMMKDYNGQTVWLSANIHSFLPKESRFPKWLNIAAGYGAEGMIGATSNPEVYNGQALPHFSRYRQFYLAPDIDLTRIKTRKPALNALFKAIGFIKFPLPGIEVNKHGVKVRAVCF